jgi:hypothetical protein
LLFASAAKGLALAGTTVSPQRVPGDWWVSLGVSAFELVLGFWLVTGVWLRTARILAIVCFTAFTAVALFKVVHREASCGCLGNIQVNPLYTFAFDLIVAVAMFWVRPIPVVGPPVAVTALYLTGVSVLVVGLGSWVFVRATDMARGLSFDANAHEFGDVEQNEVLTHDFTLRNNCTYPVEIVQTTATCICTTVDDLAGREIAAGGSMAIPVTLRTKEADEHLASRVTVYCRRAGSDAPPTLFQDLMVSAKVQPDYWVRPLMADFGEVDDDQPRTTIVRLRPHRMPSVAVEHIEPGHRAFAARVLDERTSEGDLQIELTFHGIALTQSGVVQAPLRIDTTSPKRPHVTILAKATFESPVVVEPDAVVIPSDAAGPVARDILVTGTKPLHLTGVASSHEKVTATAAQDSPTRWRIRLSVPGDLHETGLAAELRFRAVGAHSTTAREGRDVTIPIYRFAKTGVRK